jgi:pantoate--beta-alanine ligase
MDSILTTMRRHIEQACPEGQIDYLAAVDPATLRDVGTLVGPVHLALAVRLGGARLIDNLLVE